MTQGRGPSSLMQTDTSVLFVLEHLTVAAYGVKILTNRSNLKISKIAGLPTQSFYSVCNNDIGAEYDWAF